MTSKTHLLSLLALCALALAVPFAHGATGSGVVISQIYAGGGNSGATYANDYVELLNRGSTSVDLTGWVVQYASASSTSFAQTPVSGSLAPGHYYLVQLASAGAVGAALPSPDATGTTNLAASGGKVQVLDNTAAVLDFVGYGSATDSEGSPAPALSATTAAVRAAGGCTDTNSNASDFTAAAPTPRNSASPAASCGGTPPPTNTATASAGVDADVQPVLSISLERSTLSFGKVFAGDTPTPISERITVVSNSQAGYVVSAHRSSFAPADLPLGIAAPAMQPLPIATELVLASSSLPSPPAGDVVSTSVGFTGPLPAVPPGHYTATITFTVIAR